MGKILSLASTLLFLVFKGCQIVNDLLVFFVIPFNKVNELEMVCFFVFLNAYPWSRPFDIIYNLLFILVYAILKDACIFHHFHSTANPLPSHKEEQK